MPKMITITKPCVKTGEEHSVTVPEDGFLRWKAGELIQNAMPNVSVEDREFLVSGFSPKGWDMVFGGEEDEQL